MSNLAITQPQALALGALLMLAACEDEPVLIDDPLTQAEAEALIVAAASLTFTDTEPLHRSADSTVYACPRGGRVKAVLSDTEREVDGVTHVSAAAVITPTDCLVTQGATTFRLDGGPSVRLQMDLKYRQEDITSLTLGGTIGGGLKYQVDNRVGTCGLITSFSAVPDLSSGQLVLDGEVTGTVCGHTIKLDIMDVLPPITLD